MRRFFLMFVALLVLVSSTASFAQAEKKGKAKRKGKRHHHAAKCVKGEAGGPFADVPKGHWAYDAVQKSAESGILQGWDNRFHGNKIVNRYQMAVVVARMLDRVGVLKANGKVITAQDIANLESLTIEFADELALLNVKVSTLEDTVAGLKKDVDLIKADLRGVGARAGITGEMDVRYVFTDSNDSPWHAGNFFAPGFHATPGATTAVGRYRGAYASGFGTAATDPVRFTKNNFATVANLALNIDREFDPKTHFHAQININAEGQQDPSGAWAPFGGIGGGFAPAYTGLVYPYAVSPGRGANFQNGLGGGIFADALINEAYVVFDDWFTDGVSGRVGIFALPMNTEVNGPSRTYLWTITPSIANSKWESLRPVGLDVFQHNDKDELVFYVGFFTPGDTSNGVFRSGTLLSAPTDTAIVSTAAGGVMANGLFAQHDGAVLGRFPTPYSYAAMTDAARGVSGQNLSTDDIGYYAMVGTHPTNKGHTGLNWHLSYFDRNGDMKASLSDSISRTDWYAWQLAASYQWEKVIASFQYYKANSKNYGAADFATGYDIRRLNTSPFVNPLGEDTVSTSWMGLVNWQFTKHAGATVRYENAEDKTGVARLEADVWTFALNYRTSDHGWLQLEWIAPDSRATSENGVANTVDINDDLVQLNYKLNF